MSRDETARVVGFRATGGPLFQASFPIQPGLTVLYGLNGSGKTHVLDALHSVLSGRRVRLDGQYVSPDVSAALLLQAAEKHFDRWRSPSSRGDEWREWHRRGLNLPDGELRLLHRQLEDEGAWELTAPERTFAPRWRLRPAVTPTPDSPARRVFAAESNIWSVWRDGYHAHDEEEERRLERDFEVVARSVCRPGQAATLGMEDGAFLWGEELFVSRGGAVFHNEDVLPEPADDGLPLPVTALGDAYPDRGIGMPIPGLRVVVESAEPDAADRLTRDSIGALDVGSVVPTESGWVALPSEADIEHGEGRVLEWLGDLGEFTQDLRDGLGDAALAALASSRILNSYLEVLENLANHLNSSLLLDAPELCLVRADGVTASLAGRGLQWQSEGRPITTLSTAQQRWANLAIALALEATLNTPQDVHMPTLDSMAFQDNTFVILDEPEASLHRTAEAHMVRGLEWLARQPGMHVFVATHSPHLLDSGEAMVARVHSRPVVTRAHGPTVLSCVSPLTAANRSELETLGLEPSDLLRRMRVFLLVEGQHDEIVVTELL